jgi:hypothetical protein
MALGSKRFNSEPLGYRGVVFDPSTRKRAQRVVKSRLMSGDFKKMARFETTDSGQTRV